MADAWGYDTEQLLVDLHIPDVVASYASPYHEVIPATHLSLISRQDMSLKQISQDISVTGTHVSM
jgi:hypothetical protein